ncbi:udp-N-Acetylmuramyl tripeptide [Arthrobacter sp. Hiyo4]|nr:udp-N-Acetylmuramyl tripeptide [Arthrobacter sp. Hiyo4]
MLVKNPSGFRLGLKSFPAGGYATMIAINDNYADGRDMSWLWDVEFDSLRDGGVDQLTGSRAYDMALRLQYDDVRIGGSSRRSRPHSPRSSGTPRANRSGSSAPTQPCWPSAASCPKSPQWRWSHDR